MGGLRLSVRASSYSSFLNAAIVVALTCTLVLNLITRTSFFLLFLCAKLQRC